MSIHLSCGALGIKASQTEAIDYAARYGFDVVDADGRYLGDLTPADLARLLDTMKTKNVGWAMAGFPTEFRKDDAAFNESVKTLPAFAAAVERAGVKRVTTWISPNSADLTYMENLQHACAAPARGGGHPEGSRPALRPGVRRPEDFVEHEALSVRAHHGRDERADRRDRSPQRRLRAG